MSRLLGCLVLITVIVGGCAGMRMWSVEGNGYKVSGWSQADTKNFQVAASLPDGTRVEVSVESVEASAPIKEQGDALVNALRELGAILKTAKGGL